jgi:hypothetical protein
VVVDAGERLRKDLMFVSGLYRGSMLCFAGCIILETADHHHSEGDADRVVVGDAGERVRGFDW